MIATPKKTFTIEMKGDFACPWYVARHSRGDGTFEVYTSKDLSYLRRKVRSMGHDSIVRR